MKKIFFFIFLTALSGKTNSFGDVVIAGSIKNPPAGKNISVTYYNNIIEWKEVSVVKGVVDSSGKFKFKFDLKKPGKMQLTIGDESTDMFLLDGDSLYISVDYDKFDETIFYSGIGAADNNYTAKEMLQQFDKKANMSSALQDADKFKLYVDSIENLYRDFVNANNTVSISTELKKEITADMKYRFIATRYMFKKGYDPVEKNFYDKTVPENYFDFLKTIDLNDQDAIENSNYITALRRYFSENNPLKNTELPDTVSGLARTKIYVSTSYNQRKNILTGKVRDYVLTQLLNENLSRLADNGKFIDSLLNDYKKVCGNKEFISIVEKISEKVKSLSKGKRAPDFTLVNEEEKNVSLSGFKGTVVYVDFWATWCKPCIAEMPNSRKLAEHFREKKVTFLYINVQDDKERWKKYLEKEKPDGCQLYATKEESENLSDVYNYNGIPHYVLIDKNGNLISVDADRPGEIENQIEAALK